MNCRKNNSLTNSRSAVLIIYWKKFVGRILEPVQLHDIQALVKAIADSKK